jgi:pimeloyl-ACP methyl ester carboxylesterase
MSGQALTAVAADGTEAQAVDEGMGAPILVLHGGMGDSSAWSAVTDRLRDRFRTVRLHRRQYRLDLPRKVTMAQEVAHVAAVAGRLDRPLLVGHSSGAVLALEALTADPEMYSGAVLYEPPLVTDGPIGGDSNAAARAALDRGKPATAITIFLRDMVRMNPVTAWTLGRVIGGLPSLRGRVERQLDDMDAINALGVRLDAYAKLEMPILLLGGDKSPKHLAERLDALEKVLPHSRRLLMHGQGHGAERRAPDRVARAITKHIDEELPAR